MDVKVAVIGETGVGKTSLLQSFVTGKFAFGTISTSSAAFMRKTIEINGQIIKFQIWDTAGQERFRAMSAMYYRSAPFIIAVFDVAKKQTFAEIQNYWINEIKQHCDKNAAVFICGNKIDQPQREITTEEATAYAQSVNAHYFECSAKTLVGVPQLFKEIGTVSLKSEVKSGEKALLKVKEVHVKQGGCC
ncbi:Rab2a [Hexamita inflata]|uniref:Rab2a n=1 Tax=Hexamita inflata TaxID=28002 RepID=A0AA86QHY4_9EUKA|nr:Rab2a [Hexamita inflata]